MLPKQIEENIITLKEKVSEFSVKRISFTTYQKKIFVEEIKTDIFLINRDIDTLNDDMGNILTDNTYSNFKIEEWFESLKDKTAFAEPNPRIIYEEEQKEIERQLKIKEEENRQNKEKQLELERQKQIEREGQKRIELAIQKRIEAEIAEKKRVESENEKLRLKERQRKELKSIYYNGPEDRGKVQEFIDSGYDISDSIFPLSRMIERGRTMGFIQFLIEKGLRLNYRDVWAFQKAGFFNSQEFLNSICNSENFNDKRINSLLTIKQEKYNKKTIDGFIQLCLNGPNNLDVLKTYLESDFKISQNVFSLTDLVLRGRNIEFIVLIIEAGLKVYINDINVLKESGFLYSERLKNAIIQSRNIDISVINYLDKMK